MPGSGTKTESKEEPKVLADQNLLKSYRDFLTAEKASTSKFANIVDLCVQNELTREVIVATMLMTGHYKNKQSANSEASVIVRCMKEENKAKLEAALDGKITIRELRSPRKLTEILALRAATGTAKGGAGSNGKDYEKLITNNLKSACRSAIRDPKIQWDLKDLERMLREFFQEIQSKLKTPEQTEAEEAAAEAEDQTDEDDEEERPAVNSKLVRKKVAVH